MAPDDDRVWLGRANLAIRTADLDEASRRLDACLKRRPEDAPVWRALLNLGMATNQVDTVRDAMTHLPADNSTQAQFHRLRAWLLRNRGDHDSERRELELLIALEPADLTAIDRLIQLAEKNGQPERAAEFGRAKTEIGPLRARYEKLYNRKQPIRDAVEMAHLAEQLGRGFEARAYLTLAIAADPDRQDLRSDLARLTARLPDFAACRQTLAELVEDQLGSDQTSDRKTPPHAPAMKRQ